jgi:hypothetical protein
MVICHTTRQLFLDTQTIAYAGGVVNYPCAEDTLKIY